MEETFMRLVLKVIGSLLCAILQKQIQWKDKTPLKIPEGQSWVDLFDENNELTN